MTVPARPAPGAPIDAAWGGIAHDAAVAQDVQAGHASVTWSGSPVSAQVRTTFPRPFAVAPVVVVTAGPGSSAPNMNLGVYSVDTTGFVVQGREVRESTKTETLAFQWVAIGPRA